MHPLYRWHRHPRGTSLHPALTARLTVRLSYCTPYCTPYYTHTLLWYHGRWRRAPLRPASSCSRATSGPRSGSSLHTNPNPNPNPNSKPNTDPNPNSTPTSGPRWATAYPPRPRVPTSCRWRSSETPPRQASSGVAARAARQPVTRWSQVAPALCPTRTTSSCTVSR